MTHPTDPTFSGPGWPRLSDPIYITRPARRPRGWNIRPLPSFNADIGGEMLRVRCLGWDANRHKGAAARLRARRARVTGAYSRALDRAAQETWGRPFGFTDYKVSGIGSSDFSDAHKERLRTLARLEGILGSLAASHERASRLRRFPSAR